MVPSALIDDVVVEVPLCNLSKFHLSVALATSIDRYLKFAPAFAISRFIANEQELQTSPYRDWLRIFEHAVSRQIFDCLSCRNSSSTKFRLLIEFYELYVVKTSPSVNFDRHVLPLASPQAANVCEPLVCSSIYHQPLLQTSPLRRLVLYSPCICQHSFPKVKTATFPS